jgi:serine/threonine protein kinase
MAKYDGMLPNDEQTRFVVASVAAMIEYIQSRRFVYRDLKPENLMITSNGYLKLIDFGFCKELPKSERTYTCVGTLEYMAPEVLDLSQGHGFAADWWSLGILMYECYHGCSPFIKLDEDAEDRQIISWIKDPNFQAQIDDTVSASAVDVIRGLLQYESELRFSTKKLRASEFFQGFDWKALIAGSIVSPLEVQQPNDPFDTTAFEDADEFDDGMTGEDLLTMNADPYAPAADAWDALF